MASMLAYVALVAAAALSEDFFGDIPEDVPTFTVTLGRSGGTVKAALSTSGGYVSDPNDVPTAKEYYWVEPDTPWEASKKRKVHLGAADVRYEAPIARRERLKKGWQAAGFQFVKTPSGDRPIHSKEIAAAKRARDMAADIEAKYAQAPELGASTAQPAGANKPGRARQWGWHIVVVVVGLALLAAVLKAMVLKKT